MDKSGTLIGEVKQARIEGVEKEFLKQQLGRELNIQRLHGRMTQNKRRA